MASHCVSVQVVNYSLIVRLSGICLNALQIYNTFPWLMKWLPGSHQTIFTLTHKLIDFMAVKIREHRESLDPSSPRDYIDCFLTEMGEVSVFICLYCFCVLFVFYNEICHVIPETLVSLVLLIEGGQRFWFWFEEFVYLHSGPVWCWNWNDHHYFTLGAVIHDLLPSHTRCVRVIMFHLLPACFAGFLTV